MRLQPSRTSGGLQYRVFCTLLEKATTNTIHGMSRPFMRGCRNFTVGRGLDRDECAPEAGVSIQHLAQLGVGIGRILGDCLHQ